MFLSKMTGSCNDAGNNACNNACNDSISGKKDEFDYKTDTWVLIEEYLKQYNKKELIRHHIDSYNNFIDSKINEIVKQPNPLVIYHEYDEKKNCYNYEIKIEFNDVYYSKPLIH